MKHVLVTKIQSIWRRHVTRRWYVWLRKSVIRCQRQFRQRRRHRQLLKLREYEIVERKIVFVQKNVKRMLAVKAYKKMLTAAQTIRKYFINELFMVVLILGATEMYSISDKLSETTEF